MAGRSEANEMLLSTQEDPSQDPVKELVRFATSGAGGGTSSSMSAPDEVEPVKYSLFSNAGSTSTSEPQAIAADQESSSSNTRPYCSTAAAGLPPLQPLSSAPPSSKQPAALGKARESARERPAAAWPRDFEELRRSRAPPLHSQSGVELHKQRRRRHKRLAAAALAAACVMLTCVCLLPWILGLPRPWDVAHTQPTLAPPPPSPPMPPYAPGHPPWPPEQFKVRRALEGIFFATAYPTGLEAVNGATGWGRCDRADAQGISAWGSAEHYCAWQCLRCSPLGEVEELHLNETNMRGSLPAEMLSALTSLRMLNVSSNHLAGEIPHSLWTLPLLHTIDLSANSLSGTIAQAAANASALRLLTLDENRIKGTLPAGILALPELERASLRGNALSGALPTLVSPSLRAIALDSNLFSGGIPPQLGDWTELEELSVGNNPLGSALPASLSKLRNLSLLHLDAAMLTGTLPSGISLLSKLKRLDLSRNRLGGTIPAQLNDLGSLQQLDLAFNAFSGAVPPLSALGGMQRLSLMCNQLSLPLPLGLRTVIASASICDLSCNAFSNSSLPEWTLVDNSKCKADRWIGCRC